MQYNGTAEQTSETYFITKRLCGLFEEPGYLGQFLFIFLPFVYTFACAKIQVFKNKIFNKIFKNTLIPFTWINIILTLSPITLVFASIITFLYYLKSIIYLIKKYYIIILGSIFAFIITISSIDFSDTYIARIINVITNIHSFEQFIIIEPSLATRVASYINEFQIFLHHPFTGVGLGNLHSYMYNQYLNSPVLLTPEIITRTNSSFLMGNDPMFNSGFMYSLLAEHGIFAYLILVFCYIKTFQYIINLHTFYNLNSYEYMLTKSLFYTLICLLILSIYNLSLLSQYLHLLIALCSICIYEHKTRIMEEEVDA